MKIIETFPAPTTKAGHLFWLPSYVRLAKEVFKSYHRTGELSEASRHVSNCSSRWGITKRCAEAILKDEAEYEIDPMFITIARKVREE